MSKNYGYVYKITNDINNKVYVGETMRTLQKRFSEHCSDTRCRSILNTAIRQYGKEHFKIEEIERVSEEIIYEREKYWVEYYDSYNNGYNGTIDGKSVDRKFRHSRYKQIRILETGLIFDSLEQMIDEIYYCGLGNMKCILRNCLKNNEKFYGYTLLQECIDFKDVSSYDDRMSWINNLKINRSGNKIYCNELDMTFDTVGKCARYLYNNNYYIGTSSTPVQSIIVSISKYLNNKINYVKSSHGNLTFACVGDTRNVTVDKENAFKKKAIKCNELNIIFDSHINAAKYMVENYWNDIKVKTARLRISDIIRGIYTDYRGYTFSEI